NSAKTVPYLEFGGGVLVSSTEVPRNTSTVNFLTHAALGFHFIVKEKQALTLTTRYEHISNAGLATPNPGINTVQFTVGWNWFKGAGLACDRVRRSLLLSPCDLQAKQETSRPSPQDVPASK